MYHLVEHHVGGLALEREPPRKHLVDHGAQGEDVRAPVRLISVAPGLLWGHVIRRPHDHVSPGQGLARAADLGDAEVHHLDVVVHSVLVAEEYVLRLQVAVHDVPVMHRLQGRSGLLQDAGHRLEAHALGAFHARLKVLAGQILHDDVWQPIWRMVEVDDVHDVGMPQLAGDQGLAVEALHRHLIAGNVGEQDLDGEPARQAGMLRLIHRPHPTLSNESGDAVGVLKYLAEKGL